MKMQGVLLTSVTTIFGICVQKNLDSDCITKV